MDKEIEEEPMQSNSKFFDDDIYSRTLRELNDAAFLGLTSSDDESNDSNEKSQCALDEIPECGDFANWYSYESFSQPVQSSPALKETQLITNESPDKKSTSICIARSVSDDVCMNKKRRKRTKDEINADQVMFCNFQS